MSVPASTWSLLGTLVSAGVALLAYLRSEQVARKRREDKARTVDAEAYDRAKGIYDNAIDQLREQNTVQAEQIRSMGREIRGLRERVAQLEAALARGGVPIPPEPDEAA